MTPKKQRPEERSIASLLAPDILDLLETDPSAVAHETEELPPADLADIAERMPRSQIPVFLAALPVARAAAALEYLDEERRTELLEAMSPEQAALLVAQMTPDERADTLEEIDEEHAEDIVEALPAPARRETQQLLAFEPDTAGGLMTTEFVSVPETDTVEAALTKVREMARAGRREAMNTVYATSAEG
ncbi:MAG: magnesium transporter MgtE N-terminal domain-containing protein, partial [Gemmatimonadales bacterium]